MTTKDSNSKLIIYELNEVPLKLLDYYIKKKPNSTFAEIYNKGLTFNTFIYFF